MIIGMGGVMKKSVIGILRRIKCKMKLNSKISFKKDTVKMMITGNDKNKVWAFCSGQFSNDFRGNPKYLFIYINKYRADIEAYWLCDNDEVIKQVRSLGYLAYKIGTPQAEEAIAKTGVLVSEQVKMDIPIGLENAKYLNLWHGVGGVKKVERSITDGVLIEQIAKKYIAKNEYYRQNELYLATSKLIYDIAIEQLGLTDKQIIKAGYPRCIYQSKYDKISTYDFNKVLKELPKDTKIVVYAPTYRNFGSKEVFASAIPDIEKLIKVCKQNHILFIFKMHPLLEKEASFLSAKEKYQNCKWLNFWDNNNDFYEIMDRVDLCIYDFSSIFTDFVAMGTKNFIRYNFDFEPEDLEFSLDYDKVTLGPKCKTFEELLECLENFSKEDLEQDINRVNQLFWEYNNEDSMNKIIDETVNFIPLKLELPTLYSFDIFDTLISRKVLDPIGIFYYVKEKMRESKFQYSQYLIDNFPDIRKNAEANVREYYNRTINERNDNRCEIQFIEIYERIQNLYNLTDEARDYLIEKEVEAEIENVLPLDENIKKLKELHNSGNEVILISDMYLPETVIKKMLKKADPLLETLDLYLSSTLGYQKSRKTLYLEVYKNYGINYNFKKWVHFGDNIRSDINMAKKLNIEPHRIQRLEFNEYENALIKKINTYDAYLVAGSMARFRQKHLNEKEQFVYSYVSLLFVPYVYWAMHDAKENHFEDVFFISRDGHNLKKIADKIKEIEGLKLNTKYIYASRKTWRVPSFIDEIDTDFWGMGHGNFSDVTNYNKLLKALNINEKDFKAIFPELEYLKENPKVIRSEINNLVKIFQSSKKYENYLLNKATELRKSVCGYLKQEMNVNKEVAIIEYWGRGYTQENFTRLWHYITGKEENVTFYYSRSTLPSQDRNIRKNFTTNSSAQQFIEAIFNCINYKSIEKYEMINDKWQPVIEKNNCDEELFEMLQKDLVVFAEDYTKMDFFNRDAIGRSLIDFAINYYSENPSWSGFVNILGHLTDSVQLYGEVKEFAPALNRKSLDLLANKEIKLSTITKNVTISSNRTNKIIKDEFFELYQIEDGSTLQMHNLLSKSDLKVSRRNTKKYTLAVKNSQILNEYYQNYIQHIEIKNKILVLTPNAYFNDLEFSTLFDELVKQSKYEVEKICLKYRLIDYKKLAKILAEAKYIIVKSPIKLLSEINFRKETKIIILSENAMNYFAKGLAKETRIKAEEKLSKYEYSMQTDILQVPSNQLIDLYNKTYNVNINTKYLMTGSVVTDCYFKEDKKRSLRAKLNQVFKAAKGKKVICYIPYERYKNSKAKYLDSLNMHLLASEFKGEYVVIIHRQKASRTYANEFNIKDFSKDLTDQFSAREQMMMADIIVGDYRDTMFEAPLLDVPIFISDWDKKNINSKPNLMYDFDEIKYGVEITSTSDLINKIKNILSFDDTVQQSFKEKYLKECCGNSAQKLVEFLLKQ